MRILEVGLAGLLFSAAVCSLAGIACSRKFLSFFLGFSLIVFALHLATEGAHWQMVPAYLALLVFAALFFLKRPLGTIPLWGAWAMIALVLLACGLSAILPMFQLPRPTGPYAIGTRILCMVDESRLEDSDPGSGRKRELMVQLWYPAAPSRNPYAPYRRRAETDLLSSYQSVLTTYSRLNAPVAAGSEALPVLLFNPSWNGRRTQNTYLVEDLASQGFLVAAIDHTYNSEPVAFPDGRVVRALPVPDMQFAQSTLEKVRAAADREVEKETADDIFVLNRLQTMNSDGESGLYHRLDMNRVGALGHSIGGAVAAEACLRDPRIRAALDLDGSLFGAVQKQGLNKPFMFIEQVVHHPTAAEAARFNPSQRINALLDEGDDKAFNIFGGYRIFMLGSTHLSFTDKAMFSSIASLSGRGQVPPRREYLIIRKYALAFFNQELKGESSPLLKSGATPFPEARPAFSEH